jgi:hypothetical protein
VTCQATIRTPPLRGAGGIAGRSTYHRCTRTATIRDEADGKVYCSQHAKVHAAAPEPIR